MALHVSVELTDRNNIFFEGTWEDGRYWGDYVIPRDPKMTAAEAVEFFFLTQGKVASWFWSKDCCQGTRDSHLGRLHGQFTDGDPEGKVRTYKEVSYSRAHMFDLN